MIVALLLQATDWEGLIERANDTRRPPAMGTAIERVVKGGADGVPAILAFVESRGRNALALAFTDALGEIPDDRVAALLAALVEDRDFYWRPAAARALALQATTDHHRLLVASLADPLWGVRAAAIRGIEKIDDRESAPRLAELLADEIYDVRAQAAKTLWAWGDERGLPVLVEALRESTFWFDIDYGQVAREDAWGFLKKISGDDFGFKPWEPEARRAAGLAKWDAWMDARDAQWRGKIPPTAQARKDAADYRFGFELRSCQKGDFFFRLTADDRLVLGCYNLVSAALTADEKREFAEALAAVAEVENDLPYGEGGCDFEQLYLDDGAGSFDRLWVGKGGRPTELDPFNRFLRDLIEKKFGRGASQEFREKTALFRGFE